MMNNEDLERKMAFIVDQQARCMVEREKLYEAQRLTEQKVQEASDIVTRLAYVTKDGLKDHGAKINALIDSQIELRESQKLTDEKLRQLTATVDRYIRHRRNGD